MQAPKSEVIARLPPWQRSLRWWFGTESEGLRVCRAAWLVGVSVREYRELEAETRLPSFETWHRTCKLYGWPQTFVSKT